VHFVDRDRQCFGGSVSYSRFTSGLCGYGSPAYRPKPKELAVALNDIYRVTNNYELPTSAASWSIYYHEKTAADGSDLGTERLGDAQFTHFGTTIIDMLSGDCNHTSSVCERVSPFSEAKHIVNNAVQIGVIPGPSLPNNNSIVVNLAQGTLPAKHNGSIRLPGIPESQTLIGNLLQTYFDTELAAFLVKLILDVPELSGGTGVWEPIVISAQIRDIPVPPTPKDWIGAKLPITGVSASPIIGILRKRASKVRGRSG